MGRKSALCLVALVICLPAISFPQTYLNSTGRPPFNTPSAVEQGFVNLGNGNLHLEIPIGSFPQRGGTLIAKFVYDSPYLADGEWGMAAYERSQLVGRLAIRHYGRPRRSDVNE